MARDQRREEVPETIPPQVGARVLREGVARRVAQDGSRLNAGKAHVWTTGASDARRGKKTAGLPRLPVPHAPWYYESVQGWQGAICISPPEEQHAAVYVGRLQRQEVNGIR